MGPSGYACSATLSGDMGAGSFHTFCGFEDVLRGLVLGASENRMQDFDGQVIFDAPIVGAADGDDPLFERFREVVSPGHLMPREILRRSAPGDADLARVTVVSWALPFSAQVRASNRGAGGPSRMYSLARNNGAALNYRISGALEDALRAAGIAAVAPIRTDEFQAFRSPEHTFSSTWSERHVAYAAGLGVFGLNAGLITRVGINVRFGSIVTNLSLEATPRRGDDYRAPCLATGGEVCGACMARCPRKAVSSHGLDKNRCYEMRMSIRDRLLETYARQMHMIPSPVARSGEKRAGLSLGCALCQCGVPCEGRDPFDG